MRGGGEPRLRQPRPQERARRGGHGGGARAEEGGGLVRVGRAQVELEAAAPAGRAAGGLEGDAQLELARHADAVGRHHREPREQRGVEEPRARVPCRRPARAPASTIAAWRTRPLRRGARVMAGEGVCAQRHQQPTT